MSNSGAPASRERIQSLVGLRGLAALIVVVHHALLRIPSLDSVYVKNLPVRETGSLAWWMVHTPLHLVWAGGEAVFVFFVLSGLVLTLPILRPGKFSWLAYYPSRIVRLYVPVWAAIAWALIIFVGVSTVSPASGTAWAAERGISIDPIQIVERAILLHNSNFYNGPLWSIVWEVLFSLLLPLYVVILVRLRMHWGWKLAASFAVMAVGAYLRSGTPAVGNLLLYMPMFAIGVLMAAHLDGLEALANRLNRLRRPRAAWNSVLVVGLLALCAYWFTLLATTNIRVLNLTFTVQVAGAAALIFVAIFDRRVRRALESRVVRRLGLISFSLYLVHDPVLVALDYLTDSRLVVFIVGIPLTIAIAVAFYVCVEKPSHHLARWTARRIAASRNPAANERQPPRAAVMQLPEGAEIPNRRSE